MVSQIIGNYLVNQGSLTEEQLALVLKEQTRVRAGLGLIAVSEGILAPDEASSIGAAANTDRAFAEEAVARGYLTEGQIRTLLRKQGNAYMAFAQALENHRFMQLEQLEAILNDFQQDFTFVDLDDLKSDDVNRIVPMYIPDDAANYINAANVAVRMIVRSVDKGIYPLKAYVTDHFEAANCAIQFVEGTKEFSYALAGRGKELAVVASHYMHDQYDEVDEEVLDVVGEIVNLISGLYATELSQDGVILDMMPPQFYGQMQSISAEGMLVFPLVTGKSIFYLLINMRNLIKII